MTKTPTIQALVACQIQACAEEHSYPLDLVMMFNGQPICQPCYEDEDTVERDEDGIPLKDWHDLPPIELSDLRS